MARKTMLLSVAMLALVFGLAHAQGMKTENASKPDKPAQIVHKATGVVKSVDRAKGSVMLAHDPIASLKWPAMTMPFLVKDKPLLDQLQPGKKVEFEFAQQGKDYVVTGVK